MNHSVNTLTVLRGFDRPRLKVDFESSGCKGHDLIEQQDSRQAGHKMRWLIRRQGHYWPTILSDCISYAKGCEACQRYSPVQHRPASELHPIFKPRPFRGWAMDIIGKIAPRSSRGHAFILVATDYLTKWVEAEPLRNVTSTEVIRFFKHNIYVR